MLDPKAGRGRIGLVMAGGGARGAYEAGALSVLLPALEARRERLKIVVGTSVGALNGVWLAANAHLPAEKRAAQLCRLWEELRCCDVLAPLLSLGSARRLARWVAGLAGIRTEPPVALLDAAPLQRTIHDRLDLRTLRSNVDNQLAVAAVVATSAATQRTVVFHAGGGAIGPDDKRAIDYSPTEIAVEHVSASAAIPVVFPPTFVDAPKRWRGWYLDGGTRLNTPIKPALALGADRVIVIGLNSTAEAPPPEARSYPDLFQSAAQVLQAMLADPLAHDVRTLVSRNGESEAGRHRRIPYVYVAPASRDEIGRIAQEVYLSHYAPGGQRAARDLRLLGKLFRAGESPMHGELFSYLFFAPEFVRALMQKGREDAKTWLRSATDDGLWRVGPLPP